MRDEFQVRSFLEAFGCIDIEPKDYKSAFPIKNEQKVELPIGDATMLDPENLMIEP